MKYILSNPRLIKSSNSLAAKLSELCGEKINVRTLPSDNDGLIIRYGNSSGVFLGCDFNSPKMIRLAGNKLRLSIMLLEKDFPHVEYHRNVPEKFPIVARDELNRGGGVGIRIVENKNQYEIGDPVLDWSYWYNFKFELGVHILGGNIVKVFKKLRQDGMEQEKFPIKNTQRGYKFSLRENWKDRYTGLEKFVKRLYELVPIQFARLDVGYDRETGGYRLIEINSAPDLSQNENTLNLYANFLSERIFK